MEVEACEVTCSFCGKSVDEVERVFAGSEGASICNECVHRYQAEMREAGERRPERGVQTFLVANIRGYVRFTEEHGNEAAAQLFTRFSALTKGTVVAGHGRIADVGRDEIVAVFDSPGLAVRAAFELQDKVAQEERANPSAPLHVAIGLDAGEAHVVDGHYVGRALKLASRMCSLAGPGEILASGFVPYLSGKVPGLAYEERGFAELKGFADPIAVVQVVEAPTYSDRT